MSSEKSIQLYQAETLSVQQKKELLKIYNKYFPLSIWSKKYFDTFFSDTKRCPIGFFLKAGDAYIGLVLGRINKYDNFFNINTLLIIPRYQKKGLGKKLLDKIILEIKKNHSVEKISLHFREQNRLKEFYTNLGFKNHRFDGYYNNGDRKYYMDIKI